MAFVHPGDDKKPRWQTHSRRRMRLLSWIAVAMVCSVALSPSLAAEETGPDRPGPGGPVEVYRSPRADGRCASTYWATYYQLKDLKTELAYNPAWGKRAFRRWQAKVRRKLRELMAFPSVPKQPAPKLISCEPREGYELQRWECYPEPWVVYPFLVLIPEGTSPERPAPAVICCPGSLGTKESLAGEPEFDGSPPRNGHPEHNAMALHFVRAGFVAVATDNLHNGELGTPAPQHTPTPRDDALWNQLWMGKNEEGLSVFYRVAVLRWLEEFELADSNRIAVSGHSLGAKYALLLGLLNPEIKAVIWNDGVVNWRKRQVAEPLKHLPYSQLVPGLAKWFDYLDLWVALAPTPLLTTEGGRASDIRVVQDAYAKAGAPNAFRFHHYPKYSGPESRTYDNKPLPEGLAAATYFLYANIDPPNHYFKESLAVPWLREILMDGR